MSNMAIQGNDNPGGRRHALPISGNTLDKTAPLANGRPMRLAVSECSPYDGEGGWMREFRKACDRFFISRGIDPNEESFRRLVNRNMHRGKKRREAKENAIDTLHTF
jgi:hypothetical protein